MGVIIDSSKCVCCGKCVDICPGNIIRKNEDGKAYIKEPGECWSCVSCMKECPVGAISFIISPEIGGRGGTLSLIRDGSYTKWILEKTNGDHESIVTDTKEANNY